MSVYVEGMGVATGIAFDRDQNLYVGDRSGTIFKISRSRQIYVFATLEPSIAAYHLAFGPDGDLFVTGPTTSSFDSVHVIARTGQVNTFYRGLGRPQGLAFDAATQRQSSSYRDPALSVWHSRQAVRSYSRRTTRCSALRRASPV
jgi:hypothetical protein